MSKLEEVFPLSSFCTLSIKFVPLITTICLKICSRIATWIADSRIWDFHEWILFWDSQMSDLQKKCTTNCYCTKGSFNQSLLYASSAICNKLSANNRTLSFEFCRILRITAYACWVSVISVNRFFEDSLRLFHDGISSDVCVSLKYRFI